jgi:hypothetical protein
MNRIELLNKGLLNLTKEERMLLPESELFNRREKGLRSFELQLYSLVKEIADNYNVSISVSGDKHSFACEVLEASDNNHPEKISQSIVDDSIMPAAAFAKLILNLSKSHNGPVILLIDEYDAPLTGSIADPIFQSKIRAILKSFFMQIKAVEENLDFIYITGISKFSDASIFLE